MSDFRAIVVGASSGVGRAIAGRLAESDADLLIVASGERDLRAVASDLRQRFSATVHVFPIDLSRRDLNFDGLIAEWSQQLGGVDAAYFPVGWVSVNDNRPASEAVLQRTIAVNYSNVIGLISAVARVFETQGRGLIGAFSSVAASSPRRRNMVYASAKAGLESYVGSLRHYFAGTRIRVQLFVLGYVDTSMTTGQRLLLPKVSPGAVAEYVVANRHRDLGRVYFPRFWKVVIALLNVMPWFLYRRLRM